MNNALSWEPIRAGDVYCSPACGADCKYSDYEKATSQARALCDELGSGWEPLVWENMGWYFAAKNGDAQIRKTAWGGYWVSIMSRDYHQVTSDGKDSIAAALANLRDNASASLRKASMAYNEAQRVFSEYENRIAP